MGEPVGRGPRWPVSAMVDSLNGEEGEAWRAHGRRQPVGVGKAGRGVVKSAAAAERLRSVRTQLCPKTRSEGKQFELARPQCGIAKLQAGQGRRDPAINSNSKAAVQYCKHRWRWEAAKRRHFSASLLADLPPKTWRPRPPGRSSDPELSITWLARRRFSSIGIWAASRRANSSAVQPRLCGPPQPLVPRGVDEHDAVQMSLQPASMSSAASITTAGMEASGSWRMAASMRRRMPGWTSCSRNSRSAAASAVGAKTIFATAGRDDRRRRRRARRRPSGRQAHRGPRALRAPVAQLVGVEHDRPAAGQRGGDGRSCRSRRRR